MIIEYIKLFDELVNLLQILLILLMGILIIIILLTPKVFFLKL